MKNEIKYKSNHGAAGQMAVASKPEASQSKSHLASQKNNRGVIFNFSR